MVYRFIKRTVLRHLVLVGLVYLGVRALAWQFPGSVPFTSAANTILPATLIGAIYFPIAVKMHRPVPHNPIEQFGINLVIATYSIVVALSVAWPLTTVYQHNADLPRLALFTAVQVFFAWRLLYHVDIAVAQDPLGRQMSTWGGTVFLIKRVKRNSHME